MAAKALTITITIDPQALLAYFNWINNRSANLQQPPADNAIFWNTHNQLSTAAIDALQTADIQTALSSNILMPVTPTTPVSSGITANAATLGWDAMPQASSYNIQYRVAGTTTWLTAVSNTNSFTLTGLTASTAYEWEVQSVYSSGASGFTTVNSFTTTAATQ